MKVLLIGAFNQEKALVLLQTSQRFVSSSTGQPQPYLSASYVKLNSGTHNRRHVPLQLITPAQLWFTGQRVRWEIIIKNLYFIYR